MGFFFVIVYIIVKDFWAFTKNITVILTKVLITVILTKVLITVILTKVLIRKENLLKSWKLKLLYCNHVYSFNTH